MRCTLSRVLSAVGLSLAVVGLSGACAQAASGAAASAYGVSANFSSGGIMTVITPVNQLIATGAPSTYDKGRTSGRYEKRLYIAAGDRPVPDLVVKATDFRSIVQGATGVNTLSSEGEAIATGLDLSLQRYPPVSGAVSRPLLHITATRLGETDSYHFLAPKSAGVNATGFIEGLTVTGSLVDGKTLTFSGSPTNNKELFHNKSITITLNHRITTDMISCAAKCVTTPIGISASALLITLNDADLDGHRVYGQISIAGSAAGNQEAP